jgi:hypothetical protein
MKRWEKAVGWNEEAAALLIPILIRSDRTPEYSNFDSRTIEEPA